MINYLIGILILLSLINFIILISLCNFIIKITDIISSKKEIIIEKGKDPNEDSGLVDI
jgi:hypothetical protein